MVILSIFLQEAIFPASWAPFLDVLRGEIWVVPVLVAAGFIAFVLIIFEIYLLAHTFRSRHASSRRHLFLGQVRKTLHYVVFRPLCG